MKDEGKSIIIKDTNNTKVEVDDVVFIGFKEDKIHLFDKSTQVTLILDVPASNYVKAELDGDTLSVLNGKVKLPAAVLAKLEGHKDLALEIAPSAIVKGNSLKLKVKRVEQVDDKYLAHLVYEDHYVFALVDEKVKEGDTYAFDVEFDKVKAFDGEEELLAPIGENEHLDGKFVKKDINRKEVEFYYVIGGTQISDTLGNGFKINSVDGNECYSKTYKYVFNRDKVVVGQGEIKATALELLDYGHVKYVKAKVGEEELLLVVPEGLELSNGQEFSFDVKGFIVFLSAFLFLQIILATPWGGYHISLRNDMLRIQDTYALQYDVSHKVYEGEEKYSSYAGYIIYTETEGENVGKKYVVVANDNITAEAKNNYTSAVSNDGVYQSHLITYKANYYGMLMASLGTSELIFVLIIPLVNKRRASLGRLVAMTSLISKKEEQAKWWQVLIRFAFVLLVESALPLYFLSEIATLLIVIGVNAIIMLISRKTGRTLRDYVSLTMIINKNTYKPISEQ